MQFSKVTFTILTAMAVSAFAVPAEAPAATVDIRSAEPEALPEGLDTENLVRYDLPDDFGIDIEDDIEDGFLEARDLEKRAICGARIVNAAKKQKGKKCVFKGGNCNGPTSGGFDSAGLTLHAVCQGTNKKIKLPHNAAQQFTQHKKYKGKRYPLSMAKPGDLVFWGKGKNQCNSINHTAIYAGKNSAGKRQIWSAPSVESVVKQQALWGKPCNYVVRYC